MIRRNSLNPSRSYKNNLINIGDKMKKRTRTLLLLVTLLLTGLSVLPISPALAQSQPPIYFPIFMYQEDPKYAFGLDGGTVVNVIVDPTNSSVLYAGTWGNGIYKSEDAGATWTHKVEGLRSPYIYEIAIDPANPQHLLASVYTHGIDQSFNGGATWAPVGGFDGYYVAYSIDFDPVNSQNVYAAIRAATQGDVYPGGVWKSTTGGLDWVEVTNTSNGFYEEDYIYDLAIDPNDPNIIYTANHRTGVWKTINGGANWSKMSNGMVDGDIRGIQVAKTGRVYAGFWDGYGFAYSDNGGVSWTNNSWSDNNNLFVYDIQSDPKQPSTVYLATSTGAYICPNPSAGSTCSVLASPGDFVWDLALDPLGPAAGNGRTTTMYTGIQHFGVQKSDDGGMDFDPSYKGIRANIVESVMVNPANPDIQYVSAYNRGLFRTLDGGTTWKPLHSVLALEFINAIAARPGSLTALYIGDSYGGIHYSLDNGNSWIAGNSGLSRDAAGGDIPPDAVSSGGGIDPNAYGGMDPVDLQDLIDALGVIPTDRAASPNITTIGFDPADSTKMFAGKYGGGVVYSNNSGASWSNSGLTSGNVLDSLVDSSQGQKYLIGLENGDVKVSSDRINWTNLTSEWSGRDVFALELMAPGVYLAGTDTGVYRMDRSVSSSWASLGLSDESVQDLVVDPSDSDMIWAATLSGLYYGQLSDDNTYIWTKLDLVDSNNDRMYVIEVIPGDTREFYIGMDGGDLYHLTEDLLP